MLQSMTGFGKAECELKNKKITVEIRTLNSKNVDISMRMNSLYREKEIEIRNLLTSRLERGKIDFSLYVEQGAEVTRTNINAPVLQSYYEQLQQVADKTKIPLPTDWFSLLLKLPDALKTEQEEIDENEWNEIVKTIEKAIQNTQKYRQNEGVTLEKTFTEKLTNIRSLLTKIEPFETERIEKLKAKISANLQEVAEKVSIDNNRLEQEFIYYIEKLDISEEKVRLSHHLDYFLETMKSEKNAGKKLGFIAQEIGREVNTMGSKSNHSEMQKIVVMMKDELEQIKEQVLNTL